MGSGESTRSGELDELVKANTWIGDIVLSGVIEPQESGVLGRTKEVIVRGGTTCSGVTYPSITLDFTGVKEPF